MPSDSSRLSAILRFLRNAENSASNCHPSMVTDYERGVLDTVRGTLSWVEAAPLPKPPKHKRDSGNTPIVSNATLKKLGIKMKKKASK